MAEKIIYQMQDLHKFYDQREILKGINLSFYDTAKIGLIGANGSGKTTLLRIIAGEDTDYEGTAKKIGDYTIGYLSQEPKLNEELTVGGNLDEAVQAMHKIEERWNEVMMLMGDAEGEEAEKLNKEYEHLQEEMDHHDIYNIDSRLKQASEALMLPPMESGVKTLSGGERRRVALCKLLLEYPDMLLLDEPTNHLDAKTIDWLENYLKEYKGMVILITHDRYFLDNVVTWMLEIERGLAHPYEGNYSDYLDTRRKMLDVKRKNDASRDKTLEREREWLGKTPAARQKQSKARLQRYQDLMKEKAEDQADDLDLRIPPGPRLGDQVVDIRELKKSFGERVLFDDLSFSIQPGAKLGVIGPNGAGKTTLMKMILGDETVTDGEVIVGSTVVPTYVDQSRTVLDDNETVFNNITDGNLILEFGNRTIDARAYVSRFNFKGEDQQRLLGECSGGMRNRVVLAKMLREPANLVILDEPTNDLDLDTLRVLEEAILHYRGSMIIVTHDRYFLDRVASHILAFEGDGVIHYHHGDYASYKDWKLKGGVDIDAKDSKFAKFDRR